MKIEILNIHTFEAQCKVSETEMIRCVIGAMSGVVLITKHNPQKPNNQDEWKLLHSSTVNLFTEGGKIRKAKAFENFLNEKYNGTD